ncbi:protein-glutamate methylesterase/protein-glutamine glutaminase [Lichenicoccus sp.]|uniref:protein-glutamate methylesterase/protein-glutamine glutaminase n=1 Tax=Lichenicoccus sp. TaxID=2781899 RepID=UPI003D0EA991
MSGSRQGLPAGTSASPGKSGQTGIGPIRVLICDDSFTVRSVIARILRAEPDIEIAGLAADGEKAAEALRQGGIDVVVLDVEMPVMDGLTALPHLLKIDPSVRVIMASALTTTGGAIAMQALQAGAADYVPKPAAHQTDEFVREILAKIRGQARLRRQRSIPERARAPATVRAAPGAAPAVRAGKAPLLLAVGSSTGGPQALFSLFRALGRPLRVPIIVTQHMPPVFTRSLAEHIDRLGARGCSEAVDDEVLRPDRIYVAPGDRHLTVQARGQALHVKLTSEPPENSCRPAVDPMLRSASAACGGRVLAVILTGMGQDGLRGAQGLVEAGGTVLAQDEASSVVWGMPGAVAKAGLCHAVLGIDELAEKVTQIVNSAP